MQRPSVASEIVQARIETLLEEAGRSRRTRRGGGGAPPRLPARLRATVGAVLLWAGTRLLGEVEPS